LGESIPAVLVGERAVRSAGGHENSAFVSAPHPNMVGAGFNARRPYRARAQSPRVAATPTTPPPEAGKFRRVGNAMPGVSCDLRDAPQTAGLLRMSGGRDGGGAGRVLKGTHRPAVVAGAPGWAPPEAQKSAVA